MPEDFRFNFGLRSRKNNGSPEDTLATFAALRENSSSRQDAKNLVR